MCNSLFVMSYSIPFKSLSSLPNQRYPNPIFMPINPLRLSPDFLILYSLSVTRNNNLSTDRFPLKYPVPNFTALCTVQSLLPLLHSLPISKSAAPLLCSLIYFRLSYELFPELHKYFPISHHTPILQPLGHNIRVVRNRNLNKMHMIIIIVSQPIPVAGRSEVCVCGRTLVWIAGSNPAEGMDVCLCECYVLSRRGPCFGLITRPKES